MDHGLSPVQGGWRVLIVGTHVADTKDLAERLGRHGHTATGVGTGAEALRACGDADLILTELELPDLDGLEVCRAIRTSADTPVIFVSDRGSELDRVLGLQAGADDYVVKPYGFRELLARMQAVMRRRWPPARPAGALVRGALRVDPAFRKVTVGGREVRLTRKEYELLYLLASHPDDVIPRKQIMAQVWGGSWSRRTLDTHASSVRNKLGSSDWIIAVRGVGFRLGEA